ncbi:MAG: type II toxin-antitoxin system RelE/ParE family toxin [Spirochaetes bacterium]|nr:type II toxin-antitoxin system RelE/ParE family toxin [Spirochaetota bacterium]
MKVVLEKKAIKYFERLSKSTRIRINEALRGLSCEPPQGDIKKLQGRSNYRLRVGNLRVLYRIEPDVIIITNIAPRGQAYKE